MYFIKHKLINDLARYEEIVIWGAGDFANRAYTLLSAEGLIKKIKAFVVSKEQDKCSIEKIPVICIDKLQMNTGDTAILIAVSKKYNEEIKSTASEYGLSNVFDINDYFIGITKERELIRDITFDTFVEYMIDWAVDSTYKELCQYEQARDYLWNLALNRIKSNKKNVVFVTGQIFIRTTKISLALKKRGLSVKVLQLDIGEYPGEGELVEQGIEIVKCSSLAELFAKALEEAPFIYYIDPPFQDATIASFMIKNKQYYGKTVFGEFDVFKDFIGNPLPEYRYAAERFAMEHADGVVWRYDAKEYFEERYGYQYSGKSIQFYDYCGDYPQIEYKGSEDVLKICWLPTVLSIHLKKYEIDEKYTHFATVKDMVKLVAHRDDCLLDIYAWNPSAEEVEIMKAIEEEYDNVKFYYHVPHADLMELLQQYDYGTFLYKHKEPTEYVEENVGCYITKEKGIYSACNKFFDYIGAGIPIISDHPIKECDYLEQFGVIVKMNVNNFDFDYLKKNKDIYRKRVAEERQGLLIDNQINRLIEFFEKVGNEEK